MKTLAIFLAAVFLTACAFAQAPQKMSYQSVIRNSGNVLVSNTKVTMRISILRGTTPVYVERQTATSNTNGLVTIEIGNGIVLSGIFASIDWSLGAHFIKTETDPTGGTNYSIFGTSELLSVPYALYAENGGSSGGGNSVVKRDSTTVFVTPHQLAQNTQSFEIEIAENGIKKIELPFTLKTTAMVWCNGVILKINQWSGIGTWAITLYIDTKINDLIKIQN